MLAEIYRTRKPDVFLLIPKDATFAAVPEDIISQLGRPVFLTSRELNNLDLAISAEKISLDFQTRGFSIWETPKTTDLVQTLPSIADRTLAAAA